MSNNKSQYLFPEIRDSISKKDKERLTPHLANYNKLAMTLMLPYINEDDVKKMIILECSNGKIRKPIIDKLVGKLMGIQRHNIKEKIYARIRARSEV